MTKSPAGQSLDLINIMAYDVGNKQSTGLHQNHTCPPPSQSPSLPAGVNLAMAKSPAGQSLDLVHIMAYDAGNNMCTP